MAKASASSNRTRKVPAIAAPAPTAIKYRPVRPLTKLENARTTRNVPKKRAGSGKAKHALGGI